MKVSKVKFKLLSLLLFPLGLAISFYLSNHSYFVEKYYSRGTFIVVGRLLSRLSSILPFSLAEITLVLLVLYLVFKLFKLVVILFKNKSQRKQMAKTFLLDLSAFFSIVYFLFIALWGLNYHRLPLSSSLGLDAKPSGVDELAALCDKLIIRANSIRNELPEDSNGVMQLSKPIPVIFEDLKSGYETASLKYPILGGDYGRAKGVLLSELMSYTGITGVYFPFTGEANVNISIPSSDIPSTAAHEMAHQRGFAREDEANYISYLVCTLHPDAEYQYSGIQLALIYSMNALYENDINKYKELKSKYSVKVARDLKYISAFWQRYEGPVDRISSNINDVYLKSNLQESGIKSYGRMVDLLLAEQRKHISFQ